MTRPSSIKAVVLPQPAIRKIEGKRGQQWPERRSVRAISVAVSEQSPARRPESDTVAVKRAGFVRRQLDFDMVMIGADIHFDMACTGNAAAGGQQSGDATAIAVAKLDIVRAKMEIGLAIGRILEAKNLSPELALS